MKNSPRKFASVLILFAACSGAWAQIAPIATTQLGLTRSNVQSAVVHGDGTVTSIPIAVTDPPTNKDVMDIIASDPATQISITLPNGTQIVPIDGAMSNGLTFHVYSIPNDATYDALVTMVLPGNHVFVEFSTSAATGQYSVNATGTGSDSALMVVYTPFSGIAVSAITDSTSYRQGDLAILSALVFNGTMPVTQATVQATIGSRVPVQGTMGNYVLTDQQQVTATTTRYTYTAQFTNSGPAAPNVTATATTSDPNSDLIADTIFFGDVPDNGVVTSQTSFIIERPTSEAFDPSTLEWKISSIAAPSTVTLLDSGTYDDATGDGVYTGTFTPPTAGDYIADMTVSVGGSQVRTATAHFQVTPVRAQFASFREDPLYAGNGSIYQINSVATLNVTQAGPYRYELTLTANNGRSIRGSGEATLAAGTQDIAVSLSSDQLITLQMDGPWERVQAKLTYSPESSPELTDYMDDAGATSAFTLASLRRDPPYLTGQNTFQGVDANGVPGFELLHVQVGIVAGGGTCNYSARLIGSSGNEIDFVSTSTDLPDVMPGYLVFDFNGAKIARSGDPGPFSLRSLSADCLAFITPAPSVIPIPGFGASQFEMQPANFSLSASPPAQTVLPGGTASYEVSAAPLGGFEGQINLSVAGVPTSATGTLMAPILITSGATRLA
ncbi:MAG TPA: hypothetical protein VFW94_14430, partial [Candidatus Acidoferrales bacterium]|nr:hypothetical protein [Candidatus Acidoferrales bacterium]